MSEWWHAGTLLEMLSPSTGTVVGVSQRQEGFRLVSSNCIAAEAHVGCKGGP